LIAAAVAALGGCVTTWQLARRDGAGLNRLLARSAGLELLTGVAVILSYTL